LPRLPNYPEDHRRRKGQFPRPIAHGQPCHGKALTDEDSLYPVALPDQTPSAFQVEKDRLTRAAAALFAGLGLRFGTYFPTGGKGGSYSVPPPGITGMGIIFASIFSGMEMIWDRQFGFLEETQIAQVARAEIMIGRTLGVATVATMQGPLSLLLPFLRNFGRTSGDWCRQRFWS